MRYHYYGGFNFWPPFKKLGSIYKASTVRRLPTMAPVSLVQKSRMSHFAASLCCWSRICLCTRAIKCKLARMRICSAISMGWQLAWQIWPAYWHNQQATWGSVCSVLLLDRDKAEQAFYEERTPEHTHNYTSYSREYGAVDAHYQRWSFFILGQVSKFDLPFRQNL